MSDGISIEHKLLHDASLLDISIIESEMTPTVGDEDWSVRMQLQVDEWNCPVLMDRLLV